MIDLGVFLASNAKPDLEEVELSSVAYKTISEVSLLPENDVVDSDFVVVCDNPVWVVKSIGSNGRVSYYSHDGGDLICLLSGKRRSWLSYAFDGKKLTTRSNRMIRFADELPAMDLNNINIVEEEIPVNDQTNVQSDELAALMAASEEEVRGANAPNLMKGFDGASNELDTDISGSVTQDKTVRQKENAEVVARFHRMVQDVSGEKPLDRSILVAEWQKYARFICFITPSDKRHNITVAKQKKSKLELTDDVPDDVRTRFNQEPSSIDRQWLRASYEVQAKEVKPGRAVGVAVRVPSYLKDCSLVEYIRDAVKKSAENAFANGDDSTAVEILTIDDFYNKLGLTHGEIKEDESTVLEGSKPGKISLKYVPRLVRAVTKKGTTNSAGSQIDWKLVKQGHGNKSPVHDKNYFPLVTYDNIDINLPMPQDVVDSMNNYTFKPLFKPRKKDAAETDTKYSSLIPDHQVHITRHGDEEFSSDYITNDAAKKVGLTVTAFFDNKLVRPSVLLSRKFVGTRQDGSSKSPQFVRYDCKDARQMEDEEYRAKSSLGRPEFSHIIEAVGEDLLSPTLLGEKFKRSGGGGGTKNKSYDMSAMADAIQHVVEGRLSTSEFKLYSVG